MGLKPVDEAISYLLGLVRPTAEVEIRSLPDALNLALAEDVISPLNVPPADNSAMDGYAIAVDHVGEDWIEVSDRIPAGSVGQTLKPGTVARIFTGAEIPDGADTVVIQENTESKEGLVKLTQVPNRGENVRRRGQDIEAGTCVLEKGNRLTPSRLSLLASIGLAEVPVFKPLRIAILSTGDELVEPGSEISAGQIYNSNRYALRGLIEQMGMVVVDMGIVEDTSDATESALAEAAAEADCILTSGGVSVGEEDHVKTAVEKLGHLDVWKLAIKPGKPLAYGEVNGTPIFGLPGNPVSTFVTFMIIARPYLLAMQGLTGASLPIDYVASGFDFKGGGRREYLRVRRVTTESGVQLDRYPNQGSGVMSSVAWAEGLAEVEIDQQVHRGDMLKVYLLDQ